MTDTGAGCLDDHVFSARDKEAIGASLTDYPQWSVDYETVGHIQYATVRPAPRLPDAPVLTLARQGGLTGFAAQWADGSQFCAALSESLSDALGFIVQSIEDTLDDVLALAGLDLCSLLPGGQA